MPSSVKSEERKKRKRKRSRSRSRSRSRDKKNPEEYTLRGRRRRRPRYWDVTPEEALKMGLPLGPAGMQMPMMQQPRETKIYCGFGALNFQPDEADLKRFLNITMVAAQGEDRVPGDSVTRIFLDSVKRYAFIHFRTAEEAEQALDLDGILYRGCRLKIGRAISNTAQGAAPASIARPSKPFNIDRLGIIKTKVEDGPNKIYIGGIPATLTDEQVKELLQTYGPLRAFFMFKDYTNQMTMLSRGYAFAEYRDPNITQAAIKGLNGIKIGDKNLHVALHDPALSGGSGTAPPNLIDLGLSAVPKQDVTKVICLLQMVTEDDLQDPTEYTEIVDDIKDECGNYGTVKSIAIPRPGQSGVGKVFVEFADVAGSTKGRKALEGRQFMGRTVLATFYDEEKYAKKQF